MQRLHLKPLAALAGLTVMLAAPAAFAEQSCTLTGKMMSKDAMTKSLHDRGYTQIRDLATHNGCYEAKGIDGKGRRFELELNGASGEIVNAE